MLKALLGFKNILLVIFGLMLIVLILSLGKAYDRSELAYGVTFSVKQARNLGLDWQKAYLSIMDDLGVKRLRLSAYWDEVEPQPDQYVWSDLDWQVTEAKMRDASIILAVGGRLPRWPECHFPAWANDLSKEQREAKQLGYLRASVERYRGVEKIIAWQVENEPFLNQFGECPTLDPSFLDQEIALVKSLDNRPVIITDSGELSVWIPAAKRADIFGTTMYRDTYSRWLKSYIHYPITPAFFRFKQRVTGWFAKPEDWIVIELAAEPWGPTSYKEMTQEEKDRTMSLAKFKEIVEFSRQAGYRTFYLWGAEWWYWEKEMKAQPAYWEYAKTLFRK
jgi:hypothetical protein